MLLSNSFVPVGPVARTITGPSRETRVRMLKGAGYDVECRADQEVSEALDREDTFEIYPNPPSAKCPVLTVGPRVVRRPKLEASLKHIIYATDFSSDSAHAAPYAISLAEEFNAKITLMHVLPPELRTRSDRNRLMSFFKSELERLVPEEAQTWCEPEFILEYGGSAEAIIELAEERAADLIVLGTRKANGGVLTYFKSGVAYQVMCRAECPVFTVTGEKEYRA